MYLSYKITILKNINSLLKETLEFRMVISLSILLMH